MSQKWRIYESYATLGSGSLEQDGTLCIVAMEKEKQTGLMHEHRLSKRQRHADKTGETLAHGVVPPLHMGRFSRLLAYGCMLLLGDHTRIHLQKVREALPLAILWRNGLPQPLTRLFAPIPNCLGNHLPCLAAQSNPNPGIGGFFEHKRPELIEF